MFYSYKTKKPLSTLVKASIGATMRGTTLHWTHIACLEADFRITLGSANAYQYQQSTLGVESVLLQQKSS